MFWFKKCLKNYANFKGRARRKEYWVFHLVATIIILALLLLTSIFTLLNALVAQLLFLLLTIAFILAMVIPGLAVNWRRMHDIDKSGFYFFLIFIPFVGGMIKAILAGIEGTTGDNRFGEDPIPDSLARFDC